MINLLNFYQVLIKCTEGGGGGGGVREGTHAQRGWGGNTCTERMREAILAQRGLAQRG